MRLIHPAYQLEICLKENQITVLTIENKEAYRAVLSDLWNQVQGLDGEMILSEGEKMKKFSKEAEFVFHPFGLDCNNKKVISRLYQELKAVSDELLIQESAELNRIILEYLEKIVSQVPYAIDYEPELDVNALLKMYDVRINSFAESLLEHIIEYIRAMSRICNIRIFVFVALKQYLTPYELKQLYEFAFYEKIYIIIIETTFTNRIEGENIWILDKDMCIIECKN